MELEPRQPTASRPAKRFTGAVWVDAAADGATVTWGDHACNEQHRTARQALDQQPR